MRMRCLTGSVLLSVTCPGLQLLFVRCNTLGFCSVAMNQTSNQSMRPGHQIPVDKSMYTGHWERKGFGWAWADMRKCSKTPGKIPVWLCQYGFASVGLRFPLSNSSYKHIKTAGGTGVQQLHGRAISRCLTSHSGSVRSALCHRLYLTWPLLPALEFASEVFALQIVWPKL